MRLRRKIAVMFAFAVGTVSAAPATAETWYRADTHHFVILSSGKEKQLEEFAHELEQLDALMRLLFGRKPEIEPNRLTIYLLDNAKQVQELLGDEGKTVAGIYSPETDGSYAIANREKSYSSFGLSGDTVIFHEYAHHFMFRNFETPAPAWFVEGFAEFVSTAEFKRGGAWTFGKPANHRAYGLQVGPQVPIRKLLTETASGKSDYVDAFYAWSWALTHMMYRGSDDNGSQVARYFTALNEGQDPLEAAEAEFGDLDAFEAQLKKYTKGALSYSKSDKPIPYLSDITVRRLSEYESDLTQLALEARTARDVEGTRKDFAKFFDRHEPTADGLVQFATLEYLAAHRPDAQPQYDFAVADAAIDKALALDPDHVDANILKGRILLEPFDHDDDPDAGNWAKARVYFGKANRADPLDPAPLFYFANTYLKEGKKNAQIGEALEGAFYGAPESQEIRFAWAQHLVNEGEFDDAIKLLKIVSGNPHSGSGTREFIRMIEQMRDGELPIGTLTVTQTAVVESDAEGDEQSDTAG